jgi:hypothetical protein
VESARTAGRACRQIHYAMHPVQYGILERFLTLYPLSHCSISSG